MTNCWSEGALRAYLDRELPGADMKAVAAHLGECSACDELCTELAGRAARVFALLETLPEPAAVVGMRPVLLRSRSRWLWTGAAVALAAGLAIASIMVEKRDHPTPVATDQPSPRTQPAQPADPDEGAVQAVSSVPRTRAAVSRVLPRKRAAVPSMDYFVALDDQPIESGVIMRMAIQPGNTQADIVVDSTGRARAIRLVGDKHQ